ncbi:MAG: PepSY domain-containing protein [Sphingopyxis sp.]|uniref:PepSY domain-containing protein n=1 Tax=Sphingopyxis sp. TaxID=1908224 RepID=UPI001A24F1FD|nr:PepSY domain-containing protein [Sphingopyxis sp.]MBJ7498362.1 PepSY domain-containing protein [Sphingopyxis sp.]
MRKISAIALAATVSLGIGFAAGPAIVHSFETNVAKASKAERKRAEQEAIRTAVQRGELLPLPRVLAIAQSKVRGEVVKVELENEPGFIKYEVKILTPSGRVREVEINARTGALIKIEDD